MELYNDILVHALAAEAIRWKLSDFEIDPEKLIEMKCYQAIKEIKAILEEPTPDDAACFWRIEKILCRLEEIGLFCGDRHDFG